MKTISTGIHVAKMIVGIFPDPYNHEQSASPNTSSG